MLISTAEQAFALKSSSPTPGSRTTARPRRSSGGWSPRREIPYKDRNGGEQTCPAFVVRDEDGKEWTVATFHRVLRNELLEHDERGKLEPGDWVAIHYRGLKIGETGTEYHGYRVAVERPAVDEATGQRLPGGLLMRARTRRSRKPRRALRKPYRGSHGDEKLRRLRTGGGIPSPGATRASCGDSSTWTGTLRASTENTAAAGDELAAVFSDLARALRRARLGARAARRQGAEGRRAGSRRSRTATPSTPPASGTSGASAGTSASSSARAASRSSSTTPRKADRSCSSSSAASHR